MNTVRILTNQITDWDSFHAVFKKAMGFPSFYGTNMDARIDCMRDVYEDTGMSRILLEPGEVLAKQSGIQALLWSFFYSLMKRH